MRRPVAALQCCLHPEHAKQRSHQDPIWNKYSQKICVRWVEPVPREGIIGFCKTGYVTLRSYPAGRKAGSTVSSSEEEDADPTSVATRKACTASRVAVSTATSEDIENGVLATAMSPVAGISFGVETVQITTNLCTVCKNRKTFEPENNVSIGQPRSGRVAFDS